MVKKLVIGGLFALGLVGVNNAIPEYDAGVNSIVVSYDLVYSTDEWEAEVKDEYPNALLIFGHGETDPKTGEWYIYPSWGSPMPVELFVSFMRAYHPDRHIVLVVCNPDSLPLAGVEDVSYATENVWVLPDEVVPEKWQNVRDSRDNAAVGSIEEFEEL